MRQRALAISRGQGADIAEAEDIAQEVMLRLWQMLDDIKDTARMERLSAVMARNMTIDMLRKRRTMPLCGNEVRLVALHDTPDESLEAAEEESWLRQRLRQLPPTQYAILGMRQVEHLSNEEIASRSGTSFRLKYSSRMRSSSTFVSPSRNLCNNASMSFSNILFMFFPPSYFIK